MLPCLMPGGTQEQRPLEQEAMVRSPVQSGVRKERAARSQVRRAYAIHGPPFQERPSAVPECDISPCRHCQRLHHSG